MTTAFVQLFESVKTFKQRIFDMNKTLMDVFLTDLKHALLDRI